MYFFEGNEELGSLISEADNHQHSGSCGQQPRAPQAEDRRRASPADTSTVSGRVLTYFGRVGTVGMERGYSWSFIPFQAVCVPTEILGNRATDPNRN